MHSDVMHWVRLHHPERAKHHATERSPHGDQHGAQEHLRKIAARIATYAGADRELHATVQELQSLAKEIAEKPLDSTRRKDLRFQSQRASRGQREYRA